MRAYAPSIAQGEGRSLGEWRIGVVSLRPLTIHQERKIASQHIKLLHIKYVVNGAKKGAQKKNTKKRPSNHRICAHKQPQTHQNTIQNNKTKQKRELIHAKRRKSFK
jgi:hypothetical protein